MPHGLILSSGFHLNKHCQWYECIRNITMVSLMKQEISTLPGYMLSLPICIGVCFFCFTFVFVLMNCLCICIIQLLKKPFWLLYSAFFSIVSVKYVLIDWLIDWLIDHCLTSASSISAIPRTRTQYKLKKKLYRNQGRDHTSTIL